MRQPDQIMDDMRSLIRENISEEQKIETMSNFISEWIDASIVADLIKKAEDEKK